MKIYKLVILSILCLFTLNACTDGFVTINTNPNNPTTAQPEYLFGLTEVNMMKTLGAGTNWTIFGNFTNQLSFIGGDYPNFGHDQSADAIWSSMYITGIFPLVQIIKTYGNNTAYSNRVNIAKIWKSYIFSQAVALWGPIPYTKACTGNAYIPYDDEKTVYLGIMQDLKDAYTALNPTGDTYPAAAEPFLGSDITKWSKFAHSLRLRIASRIAEVPANVEPGLAQTAQGIIKEELDNAENGLLLSSNTDNCVMTFQSDLVNQNPYFSQIKNRVPVPSLAVYPVIHESFILYMSPNTYNDPRTAKIMTKGSAGTKIKPLPTYLGRPSTQAAPRDYQWLSSNIYDGLVLQDFSQLNTAFAASTASLMIMSYPEICSIRAEAEFKGYWTGPESVDQYYYDAIDAGCARYGITGATVDSYKKTAGIQWSTPSDTVTTKTHKRSSYFDYLGISTSYLGGSEDNFKRIVLQHWINLFYQGIDSWTLLRRTQVLQFPPHWNCEQQGAYVTGYYAYIPQRLVYPLTEVNINQKETQNAITNLLKGGTDEMPMKLIFCKDVMPLPGYPNTAKSPLK